MIGALPRLFRSRGANLVLVLLILAVLGSIGFRLYPASKQETAKARLKPSSIESVSLGEEVYRQTCAACHGLNLEGQPNWQRRFDDGRLPAPPHDETGHTWHHPDGVLFELTKFGVAAYLEDSSYESDMPVFKDVLSDEEILAALSFIKSRWPPEVQARHDEINGRAAP